MGKPTIGTCELCLRTHLSGLSFHHLIPRKLHRTNWFIKRYERDFMRTHGLMLCGECHQAVHTFIPNEKELGRSYPTRELLLGHPMIAKHLQWISKRPYQRLRM